MRPIDMQSPFAEALGRRIRDRRQNKGLSLRKLAAKVGISNAFLCQLENGQSLPTAGIVARLCIALDVSADWLLDVDGLRKERDR